MLRVSATACSIRFRMSIQSSGSRSGPADRRGLRRALSVAWRTSAHACSTSSSRSRVSLEPAVEILVGGTCGEAVRHRDEQLADAVVQRVDRRDRRTSTQGRPHRDVDHQADRDPDAGVGQPLDQGDVLPGGACGEDDQRGRRHRRRLAAEPWRSTHHHPDQQHDGHRDDVHAERAPDRPGEHDPDDGGPDLPSPLRERPVDRRVHDQERRPGREERLREVEYLADDDPGQDPRQHRLGQLGAVTPEDRIAPPVSLPASRRLGHGHLSRGRPSSTQPQRIGAPEIERAMTRRWISEVPSKIV